MKELKKADSWTVGDGYGTYVDEDGFWVQSPDYEELFQAYELQIRET